MDIPDVLAHGPEADAYYAALHARHFDPDSATGSYFTETGLTLTGLIEQAIAERGDLQGDDAAQLGVPSRPGTRYLRVSVPGRCGAVRAGDLAPDTPVTVQPGKPGVAPDLVATTVTPRPVDFATIIMVAEKDADGELTGRDIVITAFPGPPLDPAGEWRREFAEGDVLRAGDLDPDETVVAAARSLRRQRARTADAAGPEH